MIFLLLFKDFNNTDATNNNPKPLKIVVSSLDIDKLNIVEPIPLLFTN